VHADGANALRVLLVGDDFSLGYGVLSHNLGLAGQLARRLAALTGRGVDLDLVVSANMTTASCRAELEAVDLARYDAVVLSTGANEARRLLPIARWQHRLAALLEYFSISAGAPMIFALCVPAARAAIGFPAHLVPVVERHVREFNASMEATCAAWPDVTGIPVCPRDPRRGSTSSSGFYAEWAALIAPVIRSRVDALAEHSRPVQRADESARQSSLDGLAILERPEARIDRITNSTRDLFGATGAAVMLIDRDRQWVKSSRGMVDVDTARIGEFSDMAIRAAELMVVEDATKDPRFWHHPSVTGREHVRFYAGYPLESPDGRRIGALCIVDRRARTFSRGESSLLRDLALQVQSELWEAAPGTVFDRSGARR
jgi:hypothetical protein